MANFFQRIIRSKGAWILVGIMIILGILGGLSKGGPDNIPLLMKIALFPLLIISFITGHGFSFAEANPFFNEISNDFGSYPIFIYLAIFWFLVGYFIEKTFFKTHRRSFGRKRGLKW